MVEAACDLATAMHVEHRAVCSQHRGGRAAPRPRETEAGVGGREESQRSPPAVRVTYAEPRRLERFSSVRKRTKERAGTPAGRREASHETSSGSVRIMKAHAE